MRVSFKAIGGALAAALACQSSAARADDAARLAALFGARPWVESASLSPDGSHLVFVTPADGPGSTAMVQDLATGALTPVTYSNGTPLRITQCGWSAKDRLVCELYGVSAVNGNKMGWNRFLALDANGKNHVPLGKPQRSLYWVPTYDGDVVDWLSGTDGKILMVRYQRGGDLGLEQVDTRTGKGEPVKSAVSGSSFLTDGSGVVRITWEYKVNSLGNGATVYRYRLQNDADWKQFSKVDADGNGLTPLIVDGAKNIAYAVQKIDGRQALYSVALDGSLKTDLIYADPQFDIDGVETIGRHDRVIGYRYITDRTRIAYFDPVYHALAASLAKTLPNLPIIVFQNANSDEKKLLIFAASDVDPGHYFLFDRDTRKLTEALQARPQLEHEPLAEQRSITFPAADGTPIPAYLTMPRGGTGKDLRAIVMPHGGPSSRDVWGFDWLSQYFAARGYAVLQPEFRGSTGYGDAFLQDSGFKSWRTAIGDVNDAGRWLVKQGIADPNKLGILGWSYGGYAALQANHLDPALFKAIVAVAPVTDLLAIRRNGRYTNMKAMTRFMGSYATAQEGSPYQHADEFRAPVLMFHGDMDVNVDIADSRKMDAALRKAGKQTRLVVYPGLDHQLNDSKVRADMLSQADAFFAGALGLAPPK